MSSEGRGKGRECDGPFWADLGASAALNALWKAGFFGVLLNGSHRTGSYTLETFIAFRAHSAFEKSQGGNQAEERPEGAEVPAPEAGSDPV